MFCECLQSFSSILSLKMIIIAEIVHKHKHFDECHELDKIFTLGICIRFTMSRLRFASVNATQISCSSFIYHMTNLSHINALPLGLMVRPN